MFLIAVPAAIAAAAAFGSAGVLQHRATHEAAVRKPMQPALLADLIRIRSFRIGVLLGAAGFALQVVALRFAPLILVQPLLVTGVLFYLILASAMGHHSPDRALFLAALTALAGLSAFLVVARPGGGGTGSLGGVDALGLGAGLVFAVALCLFGTTQVRAESRSLLLAVATAVCYGVTAGLVRDLTTFEFSASLFTHWQLYAVAAVGPAGFLLNQNAYQVGTVGSAALAVITIGDPLVSIGIGITWLGEGISAGAWAIAGEVIALAVMAGGVWALAVRAQHVAKRLQAAGELPEEAR
ncbi:MAG TPA: DMT family transporter [Nocardioidaceae bacterium]|nr:DMT family transporter [Nocardioidaceae bacterium]